MKKFFAAVMFLSLLGVAVFPLGAGAAAPTVGAPIIATTPQELVTIVKNITDWIFVLFLLLAVIFIIIGAMQFVTAGGKPESISEARQKIIWAAVGIIVALAARAIPAVLKNIVG